MLQLNNKSPFESELALFPDEKGVDTLYITVKATFSLQPELSIADDQVPINFADEFWGEPVNSSMKYASDIHLCKPTTDVVMISRAWPPHNKKVSQMDVRFTVAERQKVLRVFGDRVWENGSASAPQPFESMPIVYEYAFGGTHQPDPLKPVILGEARNPVGRGFRGKRNAKELEGLPLPNIEDPRFLVSDVGDRSSPAGFSFITPSWMPRSAYAGTYDETWQTKRSPYLPDDFDPRFFNTAHPDLIFDRYLQGGELILLENLSRNGPLQFNLPVCHFETAVHIGKSEERPQLNLETVLIEPEKSRLCLTWRAAFSCDKKALKISAVEVNLLGLQV